jgi:two-component sensor histidine kinase
MVQSIAAQTFRNSGLDASVKEVFAALLVSLSNVHAVLTQRSWDSADLHEIISAAVGPHRTPENERFEMHGPILRLDPKAAVALSMAVHELCTNATKYGALSAERGRTEIAWSVDQGQFRWVWSERGGPAVAAPKQTGFGSRLIERLLADQLSGQVKMNYERTGLVCTIDAPLNAICENQNFSMTHDWNPQSGKPLMRIHESNFSSPLIRANLPFREMVDTFVISAAGVTIR